MGYRAFSCLFLGTLACGGDEPIVEPDTSAPPPAVDDTEEPPPPVLDPQLRALHVGATLPAQDMLGNGNPGQPPLQDLPFGTGWPAMGGWASRQPGTVELQFFDDGTDEAWTTIEAELVEGGYTSVLMYGTAEAPQALVTTDAVRDVPKDQFRMRLTHAAPSAGDAPLDLQEATDAETTYATLGYGDTEEIELDPGEVQLWIDLDGSEDCNPGEAFEAFSREAGDYFHVVVAETAEGELTLWGHTRNGQVRQRGLAETCP